VALAPFYETFHRISNPLGACGDSFGWELLCADIDGDGADEVLAGDATADINGVLNAGRVIILSP
jgi:hypothetical protein